MKKWFNRIYVFLFFAVMLLAAHIGYLSRIKVVVGRVEFYGWFILLFSGFYLAALERKLIPRN